MQIELAPSLLAADFANLKTELNRVKQAGARYLHLDVMDGHFVPNISFGPPVIAALRRQTDLLFDVHLMIDDPGSYFPVFAKAGADLITFHPEAPGTENPAKLVEQIHALGCKAGVSIKPATPAKSIFALLGCLDLVLVMSVEPGFGGQSFMGEQCQKLTILKAECERQGVHPLLSIDGGINDKTAPTAIAAGAELLVSGSYLFGATDMNRAADAIRHPIG